MMGTKRSCLVVGLLLVGLFALNPVPAGAHFMWINMEKYTPATQDTVNLNIGFGHQFGNPVGNVLHDGDRMEEIVVLDGNSEKIAVKAINETDFEVQKKLQTSGSYLALAQTKEGFFTKTTEGYQRQSKKGLKNVLQCSYSGGYAKAVINAGKGRNDVLSKPVGHTLEIVPTQNPADLKTGDMLPLNVLYQGKPLKTELYATYLGFSSEGAWAYVANTNAEGKGRIKILSPGIWLVKVNHKLPFSDLKECDQYSYTATLTFEIN